MPDKLIPEDLTFRSQLFGGGRNGYHIQVYVNDEFGIERVSVKENHRAPWKMTFTCEKVFPGRVFDSFHQLRWEYNNLMCPPARIRVKLKARVKLEV